MSAGLANFVCRGGWVCVFVERHPWAADALQKFKRQELHNYVSRMVRLPLTPLIFVIAEEKSGMPGFVVDVFDKHGRRDGRECNAAVKPDRNSRSRSICATARGDGAKSK